MPLRILTVTGTSRLAPSSTTAPTMDRNRSRFHGSADPPPLRVTFGTGQPKLRSMWSARSSLDEHASRRAGRGRVHAVELDRPGILVGVVLDEPHRLGVALDERAGRDHLADVETRRAIRAVPAVTPQGERGVVAVLTAEAPEGAVGDAGHRREDDGRLDDVPADAQWRQHGAALRGKGRHVGHKGRFSQITSRRPNRRPPYPRNRANPRTRNPRTGQTAGGPRRTPSAGRGSRCGSPAG